MGSEGWHFQPHPQASVGGEGLETEPVPIASELTTPATMMRHPYNTPEDRVRGLPGWWPWEVWGRWCLRGCLAPHPFLTPLCPGLSWPVTLYLNCFPDFCEPLQQVYQISGGTTRTSNWSASWSEAQDSGLVSEEGSASGSGPFQAERVKTNKAAGHQAVSQLPGARNTHMSGGQHCECYV